MGGPRSAGRLRATGPLLLVTLGIGFCLGTWVESSARGLRLKASEAFAPFWLATSSPSWAASGGNLVSTQFQSRQRSALVARSATPLIGVEAPGFKAKAVVDQDFVDVTLSDYRGKKYVVLFFYPLDFTFVCPTEIIAFSNRIKEFKDLGTQVLGVSVDSEYAHLAWTQQPRDDGGLGEIEYPLISDLKKEIADSFGVLGPDGAAYRGLFIIDKEGIVQHSTINNMAFGRDVDEVLRVLQAIQHVQSNPDEVCPAGWHPGDKTMRPDAEGKKEYFQAK